LVTLISLLSLSCGEEVETCYEKNTDDPPTLEVPTPAQFQPKDNIDDPHGGWRPVPCEDTEEEENEESPTNTPNHGNDPLRN